MKVKAIPFRAYLSGKGFRQPRVHGFEERILLVFTFFVEGAEGNNWQNRKAKREME
jgi:hypothetical protein